MKWPLPELVNSLMPWVGREGFLVSMGQELIKCMPARSTCKKGCYISRFKCLTAVLSQSQQLPKLSPHCYPCRTASLDTCGAAHIHLGLPCTESRTLRSSKSVRSSGWVRAVKTVSAEIVMTGNIRSTIYDRVLIMDFCKGKKITQPTLLLYCRA